MTESKAKVYAIVNKETGDAWKGTSGKTSWKSIGAAKNAWANGHQTEKQLKEDRITPLTTSKTSSRGYVYEYLNSLFGGQNKFEIVEMTSSLSVSSVQHRIKKAVEEREQRIKDNIYMPSGKFRWEEYGVQLRISSAATNYGGYIVVGVRHYCPTMCMQIDAIGKDELVKFAGGEDKVEQGFIDQYGIFRSRKEAYIIAKAAGQLLPRHDFGETLYSESIV